MLRNKHDGDIVTWSPVGDMHRIQYAEEAVKQGSATVGLKSKTHVVLVALKRASNIVSDSQKKILTVDSRIGISYAGLTTDAKLLCEFLRVECVNWLHGFKVPLPVSRLASLVTVVRKAQVHTQHAGGRPFGVGLLVAGYDDQGSHLYHTSPTASFFGCKVMAIGARSQSARTYLDRHLDEFPNCTLEELVRHGLLALRATLPSDVNLTTKNCSVGLVGSGTAFTTYEADAVGHYLQLIGGGREGTGASTEIDGKRLPLTTEKDVALSAVCKELPTDKNTSESIASHLPSHAECSGRPRRHSDLTRRRRNTSRTQVTGCEVYVQLRKGKALTKKALMAKWRNLPLWSKMAYQAIASARNKEPVNVLG